MRRRGGYARLRMSVLAGNLVDRVGESISRYSMLCAGDRVGVAVSGGADSVALLHILHRLCSTFAMQITVLHANHQLRGSESDQDEGFVRALAASFGLNIAVVQAPVPSGNVEQEARRARRHFFKRSMEQYQLRRVALGHTRSDQAETVLFRLFRGTGLAGLSGMRAITGDGLIRPLLSISREEVREWARGEGIEWREDSSNADSRFARNRLRNEAIPALKRDFNPNLEAILAHTAELAGDEEEYWIQQIEPIYEQITKRTGAGMPALEHPGLLVQVSRFAALHVAVKRRVIRRALAEIRGDLRGIEMQHVEAVVALCRSTEGHDRVILPGVDAFRSFDTLLLAHAGELGGKLRQYSIELSPGQSYELPFGAGFISVNQVGAEAANCANFEKEQQFPAEVAELDGSALAGAHGPLTVRNWEPGDELHRPGHEGAERIKSLFQEHRILLWERRHWPVLVKGDEIAWARRFGAAAKYTASAETKERIRVIYCAVKE